MKIQFKIEFSLIYLLLILKIMDSGIINLFDCGRRLNLRNQVIASAAIYYHKFYKNLNQKSTDETSDESIDQNLIACTCLYLASKAEESPIKCKELLCAFNDCINQSDELSYQKFSDLTSSIVFCEMVVCQLIDFELTNQLPHKYLLHYLKSLNEWLFNDQNQSVQFSNLCWSLLVDFYKSPDSIQEPFEPQEISVAILQIAIRVFKDKLEQESLEQLLDYTNRLYDHLDKDRLWKLDLIIMNTFEIN